jgi:hypothetical protein
MIKTYCFLGLAIVLACWGAAAAQSVVISEFMASNTTTLTDEDGDYSDWIELYNSSANSVNLAGWYLTDKATDLTHWKFPSTNLGPSSFMVVFASNKNRRVPGAPLHTNFKLGASGEYLALVMPDGVTKATEFAPAFPPQYPDISYGYAMTGAVRTLVAPDATVRALVPTSGIDPGWRLVGYDDSTWTSGTLGVGYDSSGNYAPAIGTDLGAAMFNVNPSAYMRVPFTVADPYTLTLLTLSLRYDDGFVAYLNGTEVLRRNAPATLAWNSSATSAHHTGMLAEDFEGSTANYSLRSYGLLPSPGLQGADNNSTGSFLRLLYDGVNQAANAITFGRTAAGPAQSITADFDFRITSAVHNPGDAFAFMLIPTAVYGTNGAGVNMATPTGEKPDFAGVFGLGFSVSPHATVNDVSVHWNGAQAVGVTLPTSTIDLAAGVFHHANVTLQYVTGGANVTLTLTPNINGTPGHPYSPITNFFIAGMNPFECRVEFGGWSGSLDMALDLDNCDFQFSPSQGIVAFEDFDLSPWLDLLNPGPNMLAIQGLNVSATNSNFLIQPQLLARELVLAEAPAYLYPPTPGTWNSSVSSPVVATVDLWPPAGIYTSNTLTVTLSASASSATIRYTLDGSLPGIGSRIYTGPLLMGGNALIRAQAAAGGVWGPVASAHYTLLDASLTNFSSNLPLVIIDSLNQGIPDGSTVGAYALFIETNAPTGRATLSSPAEYDGRLGIGLRGSSSLSFPKQPYKIELHDEANNPINRAILGFPAGNDWALYPPYSDKTLMNDYLIYEWFEKMGNYSVRRRYFELFLHSSPGRLTMADYHGIYVMVEKIRADSNRVDIATITPSDNLPPAVTGGYIFSKDKIATTDLIITTTSGEQLIAYRPDASTMTPAQYSYLSGYLNDLEAALYSANWRDPVNGYANYIDVNSFVDMHWITEFTKNVDAIVYSNYFHKDRNGPVAEGPIWDWDLALGNGNYADCGHTNNWRYQQMDNNSDIWLSKLRTDPDFYQKIIDRWGVLRLDVLNATNIFARINQVTNYLWEAKDREFKRWPRLGTYVWPNCDGAAGGWDIDYVNPTTYDGIISQFKHWIQGRYLWLDQQFLRAPTLATNGAVLSMSAPVGSIYYTLDNSDPRASGGGLNPSAAAYHGTIPLTNGARIFARAFWTNTWSPPANTFYIAAIPALRISEINYHPAPPPTNSAYQDKDFEFIEIQNTGSSVINLAGASIGGGISFTFAPNEYRPAGAATTNNFDDLANGTSFTASTLGQPPGPHLTNDGPAGNLLCLLNSGANTARNRAAFNQTATGSCDRVVAEFDFRASSLSPAAPAGVPTLQDFDSTGTAYTLAHAGSSAPAVLPANAGSTGAFVRLVPATAAQTGVIAFDLSATGAFNSVVSTFDFRITPPAGVIPGSGLGFALLDTATYGTTGSGQLFAEEPNLANSIGVGFDVYKDASTPSEPNNNHVSLHWNDAQVGNAAIPSFDMANGRFHRAQVIVRFWSNNAYVTIRLTPDINGTPGPTETVLQNALVPGVAPYQSRVAFGARTGAGWAAHDLDNINVQFSGNAAAAGGLSLLFLPTAQFGTTGPGTTLASFSEWPLVSNTLALALSFNPSNLFNDVSLYWNAALATNFSLPASTLDLDAGAFNHARLTLDSTNGGAYATLALTPNSLGTPGQPINVFSNSFIPGATPGQSRLEFAAHNGGLLAKVDLDNVQGTFERVVPMVLNPGESIVVVHNQAAFISRYGTGIRVAGEFSGSLDNAGERLTLVGPLGEPILDFSYDSSWYPITDGGGFSLVAADLTAAPSAWGQAGNWRPSSQLGGSPGSTDPPPPPAVLSAGVASGNALRLAWPASSGSFQLYRGASLGGAAGWAAVTDTPVLVGDQWVVTLTLTGPASFYRLQGQPFNVH